MSEKFNLKWNDFHSNVSQTFGVFRHEEYLHDVTLITDDKTQISAHKLILSATSDYFKSLFRENVSHSHPLVCLNEVSGEELGNILDYMYNGQVQIFKESLDGFLKVAQRFKLEGLKETHQDKTMLKLDSSIDIEEEKNCNQVLPFKNNLTGEERKEVGNTTTKTQNLDVSNYMKKTDDGKTECLFCGKKAYPPSILKRHIETHMTMNIVCDLCPKVFKSRESLRVHMYSHRHYPL